MRVESLLHPASLLLIATAVDFLFGEPPPRAHPVVWIGKLASGLVRRLPREGKRSLLAGLFVAVGLPLLVVGLALTSLHLAAPYPTLSLIVSVWLLTSSFSARMLGKEALAISGSLTREDLEASRQGLRNLCSRDPSDLAAHEVAGAAIESVAENASDSLVAPIFWYCLLGLPGALMFRTVNTLDGMIGYRGEYERLGKASALLDDALCLLPSRLTAVVFLLVGASQGRDFKRGLRTMLVDARKTASPNAGYPMSAVAGLLGIRLTKRGEYQLCHIGQAPETQDIGRSVRLFWGATAVTLVFGTTGLLLLGGGA